jgi:hypothetical protein
MLKLYTMECGYRGSIVVVASSKENAREIMKNCWNYEEIEIEEHEIKEGFCFYNLGDM